MQPDSIIPELSNPQSWNRYSYVTNRPVNFNDPSGHRLVENEFGGGCSTSGYCPGSSGPTYQPTQTDGDPEGEDPDANLEDELATGPDADLIEEILGIGAWQVYDAAHANLTKFGQYTRMYGPNWANRALGLPGRNYLTSNLVGYQLKNLLANAKNGGGSSLLLSLAANALDYGHGEHSDKGIISQEFAVSVTVDTTLTYAAGVTAVVLVGAVVTGFAITAAPIAILGATVVVAVGIGVGLSTLGAPDMLKEDVNNFLDGN